MVLVALIGGRLRQQAQSQSVAPSLTQFTWSLPAGTALDSAPIVSPDGRRIAFTAVSGGSAPRLFVRSLDSLDATAIDGTDGAKQPFWSPDGTSLGFFARGKLMKVAVAGGVPVVICDAPDGKGGAWSPTGTIVFGPNLIFEGLAKVSADGGPVEPATLVDFDRGENSHRWPVFLPDGIHFLFHVRASIDERRGVYVARIDRPASKPGSPLFRSESEAVFVPTSGRERGVLLSAADGQLQARPFDAAALRLVGDPRTLPVAAGANTPYHSAMLSASADLLATVATPMPYGVRLGTVARDGTAVRLSERRPQNWPRLSPDGRRMARQMVDPARGNPDIWVEDLQDGSLVRVTTATGTDVLPVWSPDGLRLAYGSGTLTERRLSIAAADGTGVGTGTTVSGRLLRADRLVARRAPSHRQHTPGHDWCSPRRCVERVARDRRVGQGDSFRAVPRVRRADIAERAMARLRFGRGWPAGGVRPLRCRAHRGVSWCPATAAANPSGAAMGRSFSTSIVKAVFVADRCNANRAES